jgi:hypothetical protein
MTQDIPATAKAYRSLSSAYKAAIAVKDRKVIWQGKVMDVATVKALLAKWEKSSGSSPEVV